MSEDFGTIKVKRGDRAREIEVLRQHYRQHREALARMIMDAPTEHLAAEYQRLITEIDRALGKLTELEGGAAPIPKTPELRREPELPVSEPEPRSRVPLILAIAIVALALIGWLIWRASSDRGKDQIVETSTSAAVSTAPDTVVEEPAAPPSALAATPASHDYGVIRKGTRAVRQFEITNNSDEPLSLDVARSTCRCLYYEHAPVIPPKAKETLTVTVDGAKAKSGELREVVKITKKKDPTVATTVEVNATIQ
ncbi:MAG: DUF1573 domain-containing protein [Thermoanaerobaculia bacterium]